MRATKNNEDVNRVPQTTLFDMDACLSLSPYAKWKKWMTEEKGVLTHYADHMEEEGSAWAAFVGGWDTVMSSCAIMEETGQMKFGTTEREALEKLAMAQGWPDDYQLSNSGVRCHSDGSENNREGDNDHG